MKGYFLSSGYTPKVINRGLERAAQRSRESLLEDRVSITQKDVFTFPITYSGFSSKVVSSVLRNYRKLRLDPEIGKAFPPKITVAFRRGLNIGDLVFNTKIQRDDSNIIRGTFPCDAPNCEMCKQTCNDQFICGPSGYVRPTGRFSCKSTIVIYVISCLKCSSVYVGETSRRVSTRMCQHRSDINRRIRFPRSTPKSKVAEHFSENNHSVHDMMVSVVKRVEDIDRRLAEEQRIIRKLGGYRVEGMNVDFYHLRSSN